MREKCPSRDSNPQSLDDMIVEGRIFKSPRHVPCMVVTIATRTLEKSSFLKQRPTPGRIECFGQTWTLLFKGSLEYFPADRRWDLNPRLFGLHADGLITGSSNSSKKPRLGRNFCSIRLQARSTVQTGFAQTLGSFLIFVYALSSMKILPRDLKYLGSATIRTLGSWVKRNKFKKRYEEAGNSKEAFITFS